MSQNAVGVVFKAAATWFAQNTQDVSSCLGFRSTGSCLQQCDSRGKVTLDTQTLSHWSL